MDIGKIGLMFFVETLFVIRCFLHCLLNTNFPQKTLLLQENHFSPRKRKKRKPAKLACAAGCARIMVPLVYLQPHPSGLIALRMLTARC